jgi:hypothetical protein
VTRRLPLLLLVGLAACGTEQKWRAADVGVRPDLVAREISPELAVMAGADDVPHIPPPRNLRPCCAFGSGLHVTLMSFPVPGVEVVNIIGLDTLGPHNYDNGALAFEASRPGGSALTNERNGLIYTCRGGFIDTAHVRDWADWTLFLGAAVGRNLERGLDLTLPPEGGGRRVIVQPISAEVLAGRDRRDIAVPLAQWIAFQLSVWHEIATWYGWSALALFPEEASAFSPEDLYSNLLGIKLAGSLVYQYAVTSEASYNENLDSALRMILGRLGAQPADSGQLAARAVDGLWWDSRVALPAKGLVTRRNFDVADPLVPWQVQSAPASSEAAAAVASACGAAAAVPLSNPTHCVTGPSFADLAEIEIAVDDALARRGFPFPRPGSRFITQRDFPFIIDRIRAENARQFGAHADRPD